MRLLIGVALLCTLALAASSRRWWSLRRTPAGAALTTGGWLMLGLGLLVGPHGVALVTTDHVLQLQPLVLVFLGWVGLVVGLQMDRRLPKLLPRSVMGLAIGDAILCTTLVGGAVVALVGLRTGDYWAAAPIGLVLGTCAAGWPAETRSLRALGHGVAATSMLLRTSAGLGAVMALLIYGSISKGMTLDAAGSVVLGIGGEQLGIGLAASLLIGLTMGVLGGWLMHLAGRAEAEFLVVLLGLVSLTAGAASTLGFAPLLVSLVAGAVLANLPGIAVEKLRRMLMDAEQPIANGVMVTAGVLADARIGALGAGLLGAALLLRTALKLGIVRGWVTRVSGPRGHTPMLIGVMRQSPVAIVIAVAYTMSPLGRAADAPIRGEQLLMVVILTGLAAEIWPLIGVRRRTALPPEQAPA